MTEDDVREVIEQVGLIPAIRVSSEEDALFAADAVSGGGIPIVEVTMTVPGALNVISALVRTNPEMIVGAGTVMDMQTARTAWTPAQSSLPPRASTRRWCRSRCGRTWPSSPAP